MSTGETIADPVEYFRQDQEFHGKSERTLEYYERVLRDSESFFADGGRNPADEPVSPADAGRRECMAWVHALRDRVHRAPSPRTRPT